MRTVSILTAIVLTACAVGGAATPDRPIDLASMEVGSCGDAFFYFLNDSGTQMVTIAIPGLANRATEAAETIDESHAVGDPGLIATLTSGSHLDQLVCNDAIEFDPVVESEVAASRGQVQVSAVANLDAPSPMDVALTRVQLTVTGLTFGEVGINAASFSDLEVGWFAG